MLLAIVVVVVVALSGPVAARAVARAWRARPPARSRRWRPSLRHLVPVLPGLVAASATHAQAAVFSPVVDPPDDRSFLPPPRHGPAAFTPGPPSGAPEADVHDATPASTPEPDVPAVPPASAPEHDPVAVDAAGYMVETGDCLWTIGAVRLGPGAADADIDRYWRHIYDRNRDVIGDDPNLIFAGQRLVLPEPD